MPAQAELTIQLMEPARLMGLVCSLKVGGGGAWEREPGTHCLRRTMYFNPKGPWLVFADTCVSLLYPEGTVCTLVVTVSSDSLKYTP